ncbi:MAG: thiamine pyrophosphate-binding protein [Candidatus Omnitrophica bacterium]|nr:thiamine pyrophosphate-binding protein [Candidatus Omnitrophota bacterium]
MKLSDYVAKFLVGQGIKHVFVITGGASAHLIDSIAKTPGIKYICPQHEQAGAMAADAYARVTGKLGVAIATSGPGATNMLTGVCCSFYDSIPTLYITGQVSTFRSKGNAGIRQLGFQETDVTAIFRPITKYAVRIRDPKEIRYEFEKAVHIAHSGRPGPVLIDIPDNLQRMDVQPRLLKPFIPEDGRNDSRRLDSQVIKCIDLLRHAKRPVVILGWGINLSGAEKEVLKFVEKSGLPVAPTWGLRYLFPASHPQLIGAFGTHGTRYGNFAVQNADFILSIGARLDTRQAGSPHWTFARGAKRIVVDIDPCELKKFKKLKMKIDLEVNADAKDFLELLNRKITGIKLPQISAWQKKIAQWKEKFPVFRKEYFKESGVNPYVFIKMLSDQALPGDVIFADTGCSLAWVLQSFEFKKGQKLFSAFNNTPMGYSLPASIGASFAINKKPVICVTGDGGLQMNIQELITALKHKLPIKIFLFNNHGYGMIRQTQDQWFCSRYEASTIESGLAFPDFIKVAKAYGYKTVNILKAKDMHKGISETLHSKGPVLCNIEMHLGHSVIPQVKFGRALEDGEPLLERKHFFECMIVKPHKASLK